MCGCKGHSGPLRIKLYSLGMTWIKFEYKTNSFFPSKSLLVVQKDQRIVDIEKIWLLIFFIYSFFVEAAINLR
jgi:hypothetical protein